MADDDGKAQYPNGCCDHGWRHLCGGPHDYEMREQTVVDPETGEESTAVLPAMITPYRPLSEGGCQTVRCETHCSCFGPDGQHDPECAMSKEQVNG